MNKEPTIPGVVALLGRHLQGFDARKFANLQFVNHFQAAGARVVFRRD